MKTDLGSLEFAILSVEQKVFCEGDGIIFSPSNTFIGTINSRQVLINGEDTQDADRRYMELEV